jgi:hypothetical protein
MNTGRSRTKEKPDPFVLNAKKTRGEHVFQEAYQALAALQAQETAGEIDLYYFDASGFS